MILEKTYDGVHNEKFHNMNTYPNIPTPPSSNEDSPRPVYFVASPSSSRFTSPGDYGINVYSEMDTTMIMSRIDDNSSKPSLQFTEEPTDRFRFRYKSEMAGTHGSLNGKSSDKSRKQTYPSVELKNYNEPAIIRCSIYQNNAREEEFKPHAHRLIKKQGKDEIDDPHDITVGPDVGFKAIFHSMGIIHTAKKNVVSELMRKKTQLKREQIARFEGQNRELTTKEKIEIKGFAESESKSINLNIVCLRFDAFRNSNGILYPICKPLYSCGINNLKSALTGQLKIVRMDHCTSPSKGGREIFLLVERVTKKNVKIRFYELDDNDDVVWEDFGKFTDLDVHHQYAIVFKTPRYRDVNITEQVKVYIELIRPSDQAKSEPKEFTYTPFFDNYKPGVKRPRASYSSYSYDSSNLPSDELPATITNLAMEQPWNAISVEGQQLLNSEELNNAMQNIDSDEFGKLFTSFEAQSIAMDAPHTIRNAQGEWAPTNIKKELKSSKTNTSTELLKAKQVIEDLKSFIKTSPSQDRFVTMLNVTFNKENQTNALHTLILEDLTNPALLIMHIIKMNKQFNLVNIRNSEHKSPLHLAVYNDNKSLVRNLIVENQADVATTDANCNTPLHVAASRNASIDIFELLLSRDAPKFINLINEDGDTALNLAVLENNLSAVKLLCSKGADINLKHHNNGYTPIRFAIQKDNVEMVKFLLSQPQLHPQETDFNGITIFEAAQNEAKPEILNLLKNFMLEGNYKIEIKEEFPDRLSDDEMEMETDNIKEEPENLEELYTNVTHFTPQCLDEVSVILDTSGNWENLADLLDLSHCIRSGILDCGGSMSRNLLVNAIQLTNDTVLQIRHFLDFLDEKDAVEIIDNMARNWQQEV